MSNGFVELSANEMSFVNGGSAKWYDYAFAGLGWGLYFAIEAGKNIRPIGPIIL